MKSLNERMMNLITENLNTTKFEGVGYFPTYYDESIEELKNRKYKVLHTDLYDLKSLHQKAGGSNMSPVIIKANVNINNILFFDEKAKDRFQISTIQKDYDRLKLQDSESTIDEIFKIYDAIMVEDKPGYIIFFKEPMEVNAIEVYVDKGNDDWIELGRN